MISITTSLHRRAGANIRSIVLAAVEGGSLSLFGSCLLTVFVQDAVRRAHCLTMRTLGWRQKLETRILDPLDSLIVMFESER
jgi:hypothetical protein